MRFLEEIFQTYSALVGWLSSLETQEQSSSTLAPARMSELNDYAYFVLFFGQLEERINREYEQVVGPVVDAVTGPTAFMDRINHLFGQHSETAEWIGEYYELRCDIAHGHAEPGQMGGENPIYMPAVYQRVQGIL